MKIFKCAKNVKFYSCPQCPTEDSSRIIPFTQTELSSIAGQYLHRTHFNNVQHYMVNPNFSHDKLGKKFS